MTFGLTVFRSDWLVDGRGALLGELCSPFVFLTVRLPAFRLFSLYFCREVAAPLSVPR